MTDVMDRTETDVRERILVTAERLFREIGTRGLRSPTTMCGYRVVIATRACEAPFVRCWREQPNLQKFPADYRHRAQIPRRTP